MNRSVATLLAFAALALVASPPPAGAQTAPEASATARSETQTAIGELLATQAAAWNRGDLGGFMEGYWHDPGLVFTSAGSVRRGWQTTFDRYRERYGESPETMGQLTFSDLEIQPLGEEAAWALGRWHLEGAAGRAGGLFTLVLRRIDDAWRVVHDHTSSDPED